MLYATDLEAANAVRNANNAIASLEKAIWSGIDSGRLKSTDPLYLKWLEFNQEVSGVKGTTFLTDVGELEAYQDLQNKAFAIAAELQKISGIQSGVVDTKGTSSTPTFIPSIPPAVSNNGSSNLILLIGAGVVIYFLMKGK